MNSHSVLYFAADILIKGGIVLILSVLTTSLLGHTSAATRSSILSGAFGVILLLPFTRLVPAQWSLFDGLDTLQTVVYVDEIGEKEQSGPLTVPASTEVLVRNRWFSWQTGLLCAWLVGALLLVIRRGMGSFLLWRVQLRSIVPSDGILNCSTSVALSYGLKRPAAVYLSAHTHVPVTWGVWNPKILLPADVIELPLDRLRMVLHHEYGHIARRDFQTRLVAQIVCAVHWFNPFAWFALQRLKLLQEQATDDLVIVSGVDPAAYADELVAAARDCSGMEAQLEPALAMAKASTLTTRVRALLEQQKDRRPVSTFCLRGVNALALVLLTMGGLAQIAGARAEIRSTTGGIEPQVVHTRAQAVVDREGETTGEVDVKNPDEKKPRVSPLQLEDFSKVPININAESTKFEQGVAVATGAAVLTYRGVKIAADSIRYDPKTKGVTAEGNVDFTDENGNRVTGPKLLLRYNLLTRQMTLIGEHRTVIKDQHPRR